MSTSVQLHQDVEQAMTQQNTDSENLTLAFQKKIGFIIHGSTGCTCCREDNIIRGISGTLDDALEVAIGLHDSKAVCSQYSTNGVYSIREVEYELLPDGRIIIYNRVFDDEYFYESGSLANEFQYAGKLKDTIQ